MYLISHYAGWGRGLWTHVDDGHVDVRTKTETIRIDVRHGRIIRQTTQTKKECTTVQYGVKRTVKKGKKIVQREYYEPDSLQAIRKGCLYKRQTDIALGGTQGTVECFSTSGGARGKEIFTYRNGVQAYIATIRRKKFLLRRPTGKLWAEVTGKISLSYSSIAERLDLKAADLGLSTLLRQADWSVTVYAPDGVTVITWGEVKNRQRQGIWLEK